MSIDNFSINIEIDNSHSLLSKELVTQEVSISFFLPNLVYCQICCYMCEKFKLVLPSPSAATCATLLEQNI